MKVLTVAAITVMIAATPTLTDILETWEERPGQRGLLVGWFIALATVAAVGWRYLD